MGTSHPLLQILSENLVFQGNYLPPFLVKGWHHTLTKVGIVGLRGYVCKNEDGWVCRNSTWAPLQCPWAPWRTPTRPLHEATVFEDFLEARSRRQSFCFSCTCRHSGSSLGSIPMVRLDPFGEELPLARPWMWMRWQRTGIE